MKAFDDIIKRQDELLFEDTTWKQCFLSIIPQMSAYFDKLEKQGLKVDFEKIFNEKLYNVLPFRSMTEQEKEKKHNLVGGFYHLEENLIALREKRGLSTLNNKGLICHEFIHFLKTQIENQLNVPNCPQWLDEMMTEMLTHDILGIEEHLSHGYPDLVQMGYIVNDMVEPFNFVDWFNSNMKEYWQNKKMGSDISIMYDEKYDGHYISPEKERFLKSSLMSKIIENTAVKRLNQAELLPDIYDLMNKQLNVSGYDNLDVNVLKSGYIKTLRNYYNLQGYNCVIDEKALNFINAKMESIINPNLSSEEECSYAVEDLNGYTYYIGQKDGECQIKCNGGNIYYDKWSCLKLSEGRVTSATHYGFKDNPNRKDIELDQIKLIYDLKADAIFLKEPNGVMPKKVYKPKDRFLNSINDIHEFAKENGVISPTLFDKNVVRMFKEKQIVDVEKEEYQQAIQNIIGVARQIGEDKIYAGYSGWYSSRINSNSEEELYKIIKNLLLREGWKNTFNGSGIRFFCKTITGDTIKMADFFKEEGKVYLKIDWKDVWGYIPREMQEKFLNQYLEKKEENSWE